MKTSALLNNRDMLETLLHLKTFFQQHDKELEEMLNAIESIGVRQFRQWKALLSDGEVAVHVLTDENHESISDKQIEDAILAQPMFTPGLIAQQIKVTRKRVLHVYNRLVAEGRVKRVKGRQNGDAAREIALMVCKDGQSLDEQIALFASLSGKLLPVEKRERKTLYSYYYGVLKSMGLHRHSYSVDRNGSEEKA